MFGGSKPPQNEKTYFMPKVLMERRNYLDTNTKIYKSLTDFMHVMEFYSIMKVH